ncbi:MAG: hypothetical protein ACXWLT_09670 [Rhizomicrobium sp.]|jgi:hypothetical protein
MHRGIEAVTRTLRICQAGPATYEVRDDEGGLMGVAADEAKAVTSAMFSADLIGQHGISVRVVADRDGDVEEVYAVRNGSR